MATKEFVGSIASRQTPPKLMVGQDAVTSANARAVSVTTDGAVATAALLASGSPSAITGVSALMPEAVTHIYDTGKTLTFTPKVNGVTVSIATGAGPVAVAAVGNAISVTALQVGVTTYANLLAAWNAAAGVTDLATLTGTAGTFPGGYAGMTTTALANTRIASAGGIVGFCTDGVWRPIRLLADGSLEVSVTVGDEMKVHPWQPATYGAASTEVAGTTAHIPEARTITIDTVTPDTMTFTPKVPEVAVILSAGATRTLAVTDRTIYIQVIAGTTTDAEVIADIAASQAATGLVSVTGTTGTFEAGYAGGALYLWYSRTVATAVPFGMNASGALVPDFASPPSIVRVPAPATVAYDDGLCYTATPLKDGVVFVTTPGGALAVSVSERTVTVTVQLTVDTVAAVTAAIAANSDAAALVYFTGQAGVFPAGFAGASSNLWEAGIAKATTATAISSDGYAWPLETTAAKSLKESPYLPATSGSTPSVQQGVTGRLNRDYNFTIAAGDVITIHPLQGGVSVIVTTAAAAAVSASGKVVTLTSKNDDSTTVTAMQALIAADSAVAALLTITGNGADTFDHLLTLTETELWYSGTIPANLMCALGPDGYIWPAQLTSAASVMESPYLPVAGATPTVAVGVSGNMPEAMTETLNAVGPVTATWTPKVGGVQIVMATGAARALSVVGRIAYVTVIVNVTTYAEIAADWAANASAVALAALTGTAGTVAAGYVGRTINLWTARTVATGEAMQKMSDGTVAPLEGDAATGATKVYQRCVNTAVDAQQTMAVTAAPPAVNGPAVLLSSAALAEAAGAYDIPVPVSNYDLLTVGVYIDAAAGDTYQIDLLARIDDQAVGDLINVNAMFTTGGTALGAAADPCALLSCTTTRKKFRELVVRRTKANNNGNAVARIWFMEGR